RCPLPAQRSGAASVLRYIPILSIGTPHAYSEFHIFMIHYLTTSFILIPTIGALTMYRYYKKDKKVGYSSFILAIAGVLFAIVMSIILVSRFQLIFSIVQFVFSVIYLYVSDKKKLKKDKKITISAICIFVSIVIIYLLITVARSHSIKYLNDIFDMKDKNMPIFITQPYMYISQNFENLNYMINNLPFFSFGRRMLSPLFSLTFVKKFFPHVAVAAPIIVKDELTTNTLIYDFYYDFSFVGVTFFMFIIGYLMSRLERYVHSARNNILTMLLYTQMSFYMLFSFFQSFFGLSQTFVYIILSILIYFIYIYLYHNHKKGVKYES
ncbi:MAG: oligosaccharide repeat unit polymerase, partial [Lachnospiraceae bacterium]|nr:oligosaccharide repeat unit polymerase [Lachnospiraceae bacterium]